MLGAAEDTHGLGGGGLHGRIVGKHRVAGTLGTGSCGRPERVTVRRGATASRPGFGDVTDTLNVPNLIMHGKKHFYISLHKKRLCVFLNTDNANYARALSPGPHALPSPPRIHAHVQNTLTHWLHTQSQGHMT